MLWGLLTGCVAIALLGYMYADSLTFLFGHWIGSEDYSHGMFVPLISLFLIWQARHRIAVAGIGNSWWGLAVITAGLFLYVIGEFATLYRPAASVALDGHCRAGHRINRSPWGKGDCLSALLSIDQHPVAGFLVCEFVESTCNCGPRLSEWAACSLSG